MDIITKMNQSLANHFNRTPYVGSCGLTFYGIGFDKDGTTLTGIWHYLNGIKEQTVKVIPEEQWGYVKQECDDLFRQASYNNYSVCPAWWIGGFRKKE
jgi:hypothetical protein